MSLAKELKKKRDAEERLKLNSPAKVFTEVVAGEPNYNDFSNFATKKELSDGLETRAEVEHNHEFTNLEDTPSDYTGQGGKVVKVKITEDGLEFGEGGGGGEITQATETTLGGIKAKVKTIESAEIAIDETTGKLYAPESGGANPLTIYQKTIGEIIEDFESEEYKIPFATVGWSKITDGYEGSGYCISSGYGNSGTDHLTISFELNRTWVIKFAYKIAVDINGYFANECSCNLNGALLFKSSSNVDWTIYEKELSPGTYELKFFRSATSFSSQWFIDNISLLGETEVYDMEAVLKNPDSLLLTSSNGDYIGFINKNALPYLRSLQGTTLPTASVDYRGQIFTLLGSTGVTDIPYICIKDASDTYVWQEI